MFSLVEKKLKFVVFYFTVITFQGYNEHIVIGPQEFVKTEFNYIIVFKKELTHSYLQRFPISI